jgi:sugar O-acyltransferase (sialic acid O-acetyltransferase NeuD family)
MVLGIYGYGNLGREVFELAKQINEVDNRWDEIIFIDDFAKIADVNGLRIYPFDDVNLHYVKMNIEFVIAVGEPNFRNILRNKVKNAGYSLAVLIHPAIHISDGAVVGSGTIINYNCFISCNVTIGENVLLQPFACISHDCYIGDDSVISTYVSLAGGCYIGNETYIGMQVPVKEKCIIGSQAIIGMGSVVVRDIPDKVIALGNPARVMKENIDHRVFH